MRKRMTRLEVMQKIIGERQPISMAKTRQFANSYVEWKNTPKDEMYQFIKDNFNVGVDRKARL